MQCSSLSERASDRHATAQGAEHRQHTNSDKDAIDHAGDDVFYTPRHTHREVVVAIPEDLVVDLPHELRERRPWDAVLLQFVEPEQGIGTNTNMPPSNNNTTHSKTYFSSPRQVRTQASTQAEAERTKPYTWRARA